MGCVSPFDDCCNVSTRVQRLSTQDRLTMINVSDACVTHRKIHLLLTRTLMKKQTT